MTELAANNIFTAKTILANNIDVTITFKNDVVQITGNGMKANLVVTSSELRKLYWGKVGKGKISAEYTY